MKNPLTVCLAPVLGFTLLLGTLVRLDAERLSQLR
jgi:hypothetical protein